MSEKDYVGWMRQSETEFFNVLIKLKLHQDIFDENLIFTTAIQSVANFGKPDIIEVSSADFKKFAKALEKKKK